MEENTMSTTNTSKLTTLEQLKMLAQRVKSEDEAIGSRLDEVVETVEGIVATGGEANILEGVKVNGTALDIADKMVDILIASGEENGTITVNGAAVAITGLQALAYKAQVSEADLDEALKAAIAAKATQADLEALTVRVTTAEGAIEEIKNADYQNGTQVAAAIQAAIAASGHAHFEKVDAVPSAENAQENVLYLVMNATTGHYDIYALVSGSVELIDDTTVDLSNYSTTEQMNGAINAAIEALKIGDYAKLADLNAAIDRITAVETRFNDYYTKSEIDTTLQGYATDDEAAAAAAAAVAGAKATDEEVGAMLDEVFGK
jgi:soluble P-type ATPase